MPMFPDSGVPASEAKNTIPDVTNVPCDELWYSTSRCQPRFDPAAANAMLSEDFNLIIKGEVQYDCTSLTNIERAVRYINQRGLPRGAFLAGGPNAYTSVLDPPATRHNDYMTLTIIAAADCGDNVTLNIGLGVVPILRNDGQQLRKKDILVGKPAIIAFWSGNWYMCGLVASQVPLLSAGIDCWIRTDGNDTTGDGTANDPTKAFRTIVGCWNAVGSKYAATPLFSINMRFGIPGDYEGALIGPFGGAVTLTGDANNAAGYRIHCQPSDPISYALWINGINSFAGNGITIVMDYGTAQGGTAALRCIKSQVQMYNSRFEATAANPQAVLVEVSGGLFVSAVGSLTFEGNNNLISSCFVTAGLGNVVGAYLARGQVCTYRFNNLNCPNGTFSVAGLSVNSMGSATFIVTNCIGVQHVVIENSILNMGGQPPVGNTAGVIGSGGRFIP